MRTQIVKCIKRHFFMSLIFDFCFNGKITTLVQWDTHTHTQNCLTIPSYTWWIKWLHSNSLKVSPLSVFPCLCFKIYFKKRVINLYKPPLNFIPPGALPKWGYRGWKMQFVWDSAYHSACLKQPITQSHHVTVWGNLGKSLSRKRKQFIFWLFI